MRFSIIVPTYNEEHDIAATLDSLVALDWPDREILIVDDSTDRTPQIVSGYVDRGVRLIRPAKREGRCGARNLGIVEATGEVVVILNADVRLPTDFLRRVAPYYENGYDYVLVRSRVSNMDDLFARYVECQGVVDHYQTDPARMEWTEGFSCRRKTCIAAGLFPTGYAVPICAGEDGFFGDGLRRAGARKVLDLDIVVEHVAPASLAEYWQIRRGRGKGSPQIRRFLEHWSFARMRVRALLRLARTAAYVSTLLPMLVIAWRAARESPRGVRDVIPFAWAWLVEQVAFHVGEWQSIAEIAAAEARARAA
jgi:glycosyltransferase involved in cell wall biosynthesis